MKPASPPVVWVPVPRAGVELLRPAPAAGGKGAGHGACWRCWCRWTGEVLEPLCLLLSV